MEVGVLGGLPLNRCATVRSIVGDDASENFPVIKDNVVMKTCRVVVTW